MAHGWLAPLAAILLAFGCTADSPSSSPTPNHGPESLRALFDEEITGGGLKRLSTIRDFGAYTSYRVSYRSGDLTISGVMNVPTGDGPFPAVVLNHGYVLPRVYVTGRGMERERDYLAREGFVVLHTDYRGHGAGSEGVSGLERELRLGYSMDAIAAVKALRELPEIRDDQVAMAGRSMGGALTFNALVIEPGLVDAAVVWASSSTRFVDYFRRWTQTQRPRQARAIIERWGTIGENPTFWGELSSRTYVDRIEAAVMMHHGTQDKRTPFSWAEATRDALRDAGVDLRFHAYPGERHKFTRDWRLSMRRTVEFLRDEMGVER